MLRTICYSQDHDCSMSPQQPFCCWPSQNMLTACVSCSDAFPVCLASYCPATVHAATATCSTVAMHACFLASIVWAASGRVLSSYCTGCLWSSTFLRRCMLPLLHRPCTVLRWCGLPLAEYCPAAVPAVSGRVLSCDSAC